MGDGGVGGYSTGTIDLAVNQPLFVCVGGKGSQAVARKEDDNAARKVYSYGGYNGGGNPGTADSSGDNYMGGGGGATHVATANGVLSSLSSAANQAKVLMVAGGGGGAAYYRNTDANYHTGLGGHGGGTDRGAVRNVHESDRNHTVHAIGGGQSLSTGSDRKYGTFGKGADITGYATVGGPSSEPYCYGGGGGGGWYGGSITTGTGGGGGSGHIGTGVTGNTYAGDSGSRLSNPDNTGNGYARITENFIE